MIALHPAHKFVRMQRWGEGPGEDGETKYYHGKIHIGTHNDAALCDWDWEEKTELWDWHGPVKKKDVCKKCLRIVREAKP